MEVQACDLGPEAHAIGDRRQTGQQAPCFPWSAFGSPITSVQVMVADPDGVEPDVLGCPGDRNVLLPPNVAFYLRQLYPEATGRGHDRSVGKAS